jgi:hypothetical protein
MVTKDEWVEKSKRGEVCSVVGCDGKPTTRCATCLMYTCYQHLPTHLHITADKDIEEERKRTEKLR